jgi:hypothetical protein
MIRKNKSNTNKNPPIKSLQEIYSERAGIENFKNPLGTIGELRQKTPNEETMSKTLGLLAQEWRSKSIPEAVRAVYCDFISSLGSRKALIFATKELQDLRSYNSLSQLCLKSINAREESIETIKEMNDYLINDHNWLNILDIKLECAEILHAHRMLTLNVAETIERWKDYFTFEIPNFKPKFIINQEDYLNKILYDIEFLKYSELAKVFKFSSENDPFLLAPSKIIDKKTTKVRDTNYFMHNGEVIISLPSILVKRVQKMEKFLQEETKSTGIVSYKNFFNLGLRSPATIRSIEKELIEKNESVAKFILENFYKDEIVYHINDIISSEINELIAKGIYNDIDAVIQSIIIDIVQNSLTETIGLDINDEGASNKAHPNPLINSPAVQEHKAYRDTVLINDIEKTKKNNEYLEAKISQIQMEKAKLQQEIYGNSDRYKDGDLHDDKKSYKTLPEDKTEDEKRIQDEVLKKIEHERLEKEKDDKLNEKSSKNAEKLQSSVMIEGIIRKLIETTIEELNIESLVGATIKEVLTEKSKKANPDQKRRITIVYQKIENENLCSIVLESILNSFIEADWLEELVKSLIRNSRTLERKITIDRSILAHSNTLIEDPDDYVNEIFTPGVHSPNQISRSGSIQEENLEQSSLASEIILSVLSSEKKTGNLDFIPMGENIKNISKVLEQYYINIPENYVSSFLPIEDLLFVTNLAEDCNWYWYKDTQGCLVFSSYSKLNSGKIAIVHHISSIDIKLYSKMIGSAINYIKDLEFTEIAFQFLSSAQAEILKPLSDYKLQRKFLQTAWESLNLDTYSVQTSKALSSCRLYSLKIKSSVEIGTTPELIEPNNSTKPEMIQIGNRYCVLTSILQAFDDPASEMVLASLGPVRLQRDINELLEIIASYNSLQPLDAIKLTKAKDKTVSLLEFDVKWTGCSYVPYEVNSCVYKYLRLSNITVSKGPDQCVVYNIPTGDPSLNAFVLVIPGLAKELTVELKGFKTDLFNKVDNLLKGTTDQEKCEDLWMPGFQKDVEWDMTWMHGFEILKPDTPPQFVKSSIEKLSVCMSFPAQAEALLKSKPLRVINSQFVFGLRHSYVTKWLEIPLLACLVQPEDWIRL